MWLTFQGKHHHALVCCLETFPILTEEFTIVQWVSFGKASDSPVCFAFDTPALDEYPWGIGINLSVEALPLLSFLWPSKGWYDFCAHWLSPLEWCLVYQTQWNQSHSVLVFVSLPSDAMSTPSAKAAQLGWMVKNHQMEEPHSLKRVFQQRRADWKIKTRGTSVCFQFSQKHEKSTLLLPLFCARGLLFSFVLCTQSGHQFCISEPRSAAKTKKGFTCLRKRKL